MLWAIAVIAVPVSSVCLSLDPRWVLVPARGDIGVSAPRARCSGAADCLPDYPRTGVVSSSKDRLSGRLLGLPMFCDGLLLSRSVDSLASLDLHRWYSSSSVLAWRTVDRASSRSCRARSISSRSCCRSLSHFVAEVVSAAEAAVRFNCRSLRTVLILTRWSTTWC